MAAGDEIWETTTDGLVWVKTTGRQGATVDTKVGGKRGARLRISTEDRELVEEGLMDPGANPFTNGLLARVGTKGEPAPVEPGSQAISTQDLVKILSANGNAYQSKVRALNELNLRRLKTLADEMDASVRQVEFIDAQLEQYKVGGTQRSYEELQGIGR